MNYYDAAKKYGLIFNGMQEYRGGSMPLFSHPDVGTFTLKDGETIPEALQRKGVQWGYRYVGKGRPVFSKRERKIFTAMAQRRQELQE